MGRMWKISAILLCLMLCGCTGPEMPNENRFVTQVHVQLHRDGETVDWTFSQPQKMEVVLYYLRSLDQKSPALADPERFSGDRYRIDLFYTDGTGRRIYQRADRFLSEGLGPWQVVEQKKAELLYPLLKTLVSD